MSARKLVLGIPFYGHAWTHVGLQQFGSYQAGSGSDMPTDNRSLVPLLLPGSGYVRHWDETASAPFLYNPGNQTFVSYEDVQSIGAKCRFVLSHHLAGVMFWDYESDADGTLLNAIDQGLKAPAQHSVP